VTKEELANANRLCVAQAITIDLYTGTSNVGFYGNLLALHCFNDQQAFTDYYVTQKLGSRNQKFNANYGPGIYLTNNPLEAAGYGTHMVKFVCTNTPYADIAGNSGTAFRKAIEVNGKKVAGGPQAILKETGLHALLLVAAGDTSYYVLRTPEGVVPTTYP